MKRLNQLTSKYLIIFLIAAIFASLILPIQKVQADEYVEILNVKSSLTEKGNIKIEWITNTETQGRVVYGETSDNLNRYIKVNENPSKYNSVEIGGLKEKTTYYYQIIVYRNRIESVRSFINKIKTDKISDLSAPVVEDLHIPFIGGSVALVFWHTDEKSNSVVQYSLDQSYKKKASSKKKVNDHVIALKKLTPDEKYYLRVYSADDDGDKSNYSYKVFYTLPKSTHDYDAMEISYLRPSGPDDIRITSDSITVSFKTNRYTAGSVSSKKGKSKAQVIDLKYGREHQAVFYDLDPETEYTLKVYVKDPFGKKASKEFKVKTREQTTAPVIENEEVEEVIVSGVEHSFYTPAEHLYKAEGNSRVFAVLNGKKHYITSPSAFLEYGYGWGDIRTINQSNIDKMPRVKLVKSPDQSTVYYLYERAGGRLLKLNIPSPSVFTSYANNKWGDIVKIAQADIDTYPNVNLIKLEGSSETYFLENGKKRLVTEKVFKARGFSQDNIAHVNQTHFDSYPKGETLK